MTPERFFPDRVARDWQAVLLRPGSSKVLAAEIDRFSRYQTSSIEGNQGISYTVVSSAMPRNAARCMVGCSPEVSRIFAAFSSSTTDLVTKMAREEARPCTRAAIFTV